MALLLPAAEGLATKVSQYNRMIDSIPPIGSIITWAMGLYAATGVAIVSGVANGDTLNHLVATASNFSTVSVGDIVYNSTSDNYAAVTNKNSNTDLTLDADIFPAGTGNFSIYDRPTIPFVAAGVGDSTRWWECNGTTIVDAESSFNNKIAPDIAEVTTYPYSVSLIRVK